jgi:cytochrome c oxidase cbb3-type subunit 3
VEGLATLACRCCSKAFSIDAYPRRPAHVCIYNAVKDTSRQLRTSSGRKQLVKTLKISSAIVLTIGLMLAQAPPAQTQNARPPNAPAGNAPRAGGFIPGQERPAGDPAQIERGGKVYSVACRACHGADLRGGDIGGPNLLRSQIALRDREGEAIVPVIQGSLQSGGMPAVPMSPEDAKAVAAYVRSVLATIGRQGTPPSVGKAPTTIVVGDAARGRVYFDSKCASCHSATGDLRGIATKYPDAKVLQNTWVSGGGRPGRGAAGPASERRAVTATLTPPSGHPVEGRVVRIDDFLITLQMADGSTQTYARDGDVPRVEVRDPIQAHRDLLRGYTDRDMHDVTAYLVTLK